jgi:hypothetical protein
MSIPLPNTETLCMCVAFLPVFFSHIEINRAVMHRLLEEQQVQQVLSTVDAGKPCPL